MTYCLNVTNMRGSSNNNGNNNNNNNSTMISLPRANQDMEEVAGAQDTIYLCNFRVSVDGEWLCLKELQDLDIQEGSSNSKNESATITNYGIANANSKCDDKLDRDWVNYCRCLVFQLVQFFSFFFFYFV